MNLSTEKFTVSVNEETYFIEPLLQSNQTATEFKVSTNCDYMFTLCHDENGNWIMGKDVTPLYDELINQIGVAIEDHNA